MSDAWPGKTLDRQLTEECGLLELLEPHDSVMADKGFMIADLLEKRLCFLNIPPFRDILIKLKNFMVAHFT